MAFPSPNPSEPRRTTEAWFELVEEAGEWHWCLWSGNGRMVARNCVPYGRKKDAMQAIRLLAGVVDGARLILESESGLDLGEASG